MKKVKAMLAYALAVLVGMGLILPNLSQVYAQESDDYGVVGAYEAYSIAENLYEQGKKVKTGNEMIRIRKNPKGGSKEVGEIAYCFNADRAVPDIQQDTPDFTGEDYPEDTLITYTKVAGTDNKFYSLAVNARANARNAILKVIYDGFRDGDANRVDEIKNAFQAMYPNGPEGNISDAELYAATQKAIWYYTDSQELATQTPSDAEIKGDEIDATMNTKTWYVYQFLLGQVLTDGNPLHEMTLNEVPVNNTLDLYKPARALRFNDRGYQNLLSSKFVTSNTETNYSEFDVKIKKIDKDGNSILANARLKLEAVNNGDSDQRLFMWTTKEDGGLNPTTFKLPAGEYLLTELSTPEGYKLAEPITVKVSATGEVTYNIKNKAETTTASDKTVVIVNEKTATMTVNVNKEWKDKNDATPVGLDSLTTKVNLLADGQAAVDASGHAVPEQLLSKGNQWKASFKNLPIYKNGTNSGEKIVYAVSESEIEGYNLIQGGDAKVSGDADKDVKAIQLVNKETDTTQPEETLITKVQVNKKWSNQDKKSSKDIYFELWKVKDGSESVVSLADFALEPKAFQARQKLPSNGMIAWNNLSLKEQGYTFKVKEVDESGNAWQDKANGYKEGSAKVESNVDKVKQLLIFDVTNNYEEAAKTKVSFSKKALTENGEELSGANLKLTKQDGTVVKEWTTDGTQPEVELENGSYTLTEVSAPDKYQIAPAISFEVKDGKVTVNGTEINGNKLVMVDQSEETHTTQNTHTTQKTKVSFSKKALTENGEELSGANLKLTKQDGTVVKEWTTDGTQPEVELENGSYTLTEVSAPDKYQIAPAISFEVKDGKVTVNGTEINGNKLVMVDQLEETHTTHTTHITKNTHTTQNTHTAQKTKVSFSKKALTENGEELSGANLKLTKQDGTVVKEWTTDGTQPEVELENGSYTLTEVSAPDKYQIAPAISFEVKDGKVTVNGTEVNGNKLVMVDKSEEAHTTQKSAPGNYQLAPANGTEVSTNKPVDKLKEEQKTEKTNTNKTLPKTGEGTNIFLYAWLMLTSGALLVLIGYRCRNHAK